MRTKQFMVRFFVAVVFMAVGGCAGSETDDLPRQAVSGAVTLDDRPLASGFIQFQPASGEGVAAGGNVTDGKFAIERAQGPIAGDYKVLISSVSAAESSSEPTPPPGESTAPPPDPIPAKYNAASTLTAKVEAGQENSFDFPLKSR